jgi:hypothetical protein
MLRTRSTGWRYSLPLLSLLAVAALHAPAYGNFTPYSIGGNTTAASIQPTINLFTADIGGVNNGNAAGPLAGGRREINWDGGGVGVSAAAGTPFNGFQNTRGANFTTPGTGFLQTPLGDAAFTALNPSYTTTFGVFSPQRIFTPLGSNITDVRFFLPGSGGAVPATVSAFGAVFSDVDVANLTTMQFFDIDGNSIETFSVPPQSPGSTAPNGGLSFFGAVANSGERIARVRISTGNMALGPNDQNGDNNDIVVMDDFLYDEPVAIPEPATAALAALGLAAMLMGARRGANG